MKTADTSRETYPSVWPAARSWTRLAVRTRNPLLRPPTRREQIVSRLAFSGLLVLTAGIVLACFGTFRGGVAAERSQAAQRHHVAATVLAGTVPNGPGTRYLPGTRTFVSYVVDGRSVTGFLGTDPDAEVGSVVPAWVDADGRLTLQPRSRAVTVRDTALVALFGLAVLVMLVTGGRAAYDAWSVRSHAPDWEGEWLRFDGSRPK
jgi:hypothetical protein